MDRQVQPIDPSPDLLADLYRGVRSGEHVANLWQTLIWSVCGGFAVKSMRNLADYSD